MLGAIRIHGGQAFSFEREEMSAWSAWSAWTWLFIGTSSASSSVEWVGLTVSWPYHFAVLIGFSDLTLTPAA